MKHRIAAMVEAGYVAPRAGAWIETRDPLGHILEVASPPARGRGLKLHRSGKPIDEVGRPPRGGVD